MYDLGVFFRTVFAFFVYSVALTVSAVAMTPTAQHAALLCANTGEFLYEKSADTACGMASTTKIMTALLALENGDLDTPFSVSDDAIGIEGSSLYLKRGEQFTLRELVYGLMLRSANDAAAAIAIQLSGTVDAFAEAMNQKATELGLSDTHFKNPHGLAEEGHYTSAKDLAKLAAYALVHYLSRRDRRYFAGKSSCHNCFYSKLICKKRHKLHHYKRSDCDYQIILFAVFNQFSESICNKTLFAIRAVICHKHQFL